MAVLASQPSALAHFPPVGHVGSYPVKTGDDWASVARRKAGRSDPWDLIEFNFATRSPREVNWYLSHYLNCESTEDGKNHCFRTGDGEIYLPPADWNPKIEKALQLIVIGAITNWAARKISFQRGGNRVNSTGFTAVGNAIIDGKIRVIHNKGLKSGHALYDSSRNTIELAYGAGKTNKSKALIIHECVHALLDMRQVQNMKVKVSESMGYVAQCLFMLNHADDPDDRLYEEIPAGGPGGASDSERRRAIKTDAIFMQGWKIAQLINAKKLVPTSDWSLLDVAVAIHPSYSSDSNATAMWDGI
jgi:hypothetical protein